jgi:hypothetical protein
VLSASVTPSLEGQLAVGSCGRGTGVHRSQQGPLERNNTALQQGAIGGQQLLSLCAVMQLLCSVTSFFLVLACPSCSL